MREAFRTREDHRRLTTRSATADIKMSSTARPPVAIEHRRSVKLRFASESVTAVFKAMAAVPVHEMV
jgi:hypothetical protein